ncbi:hypothetical protein HBI17_219170 [Parastagonospora nodorum]|nr:hypothetical protein HBI17_219170 [Parastagonospora nodorum]
MDISLDGFPLATNKRLIIVIVGASLGGLATALSLKRLPPTHNHTITLLERSPTPLLHNQGAGIVTGGDTLSFFKRYDKCGRDIAARSASRQYLNKDGKIVHEEAMRQNMTSWNLFYHIFRANVDGVKSDHRPSRKRREIIIAQFEIGDSEKGETEADLLIAADGPSFTIRSLLAPNNQRTYAGYVALRGTLIESEANPQALATFSERFTFFHGPGVQILAYLILGLNGTLEPSQRLINFVY